MSQVFERSSGGLVYRKRGRRIEILLLEWLNGKGETEYVLPKGKIEEWEIARETAIREIWEEAGLFERDLEVIKFMTKVSYSFIATYLENCPIIEKDVYLFLVKYNGFRTPCPREEERFTGYKWFPIQELKDLELKPDVYGFVKKNLIYM